MEFKVHHTGNVIKVSIVRHGALKNWCLRKINFSLSVWSDEPINLVSRARTEFMIAHLAPIRIISTFVNVVINADLAPRFSTIFQYLSLKLVLLSTDLLLESSSANERVLFSNFRNSLNIT